MIFSNVCCRGTIIIVKEENVLLSGSTFMKIKITDLKKQLKNYEQKELIELIVELFKSNKEVQNFLSSKFLGEDVIEDLFQKTLKKIENEFFPDRGDPKLRLAEAKKAINEFKKATKDEKRTVELMVFYVEQ